ncbi:hypothetical protein [Natrialba asiatica]|uniref:Uncharacterized protein n=1 Tax=Natrialba asiatica (strain ATCC 700177 / DSM 12278 / JCM 9576 / FERM P-10747 / NBRC 102637 / 172P1) TaxID=29540 RepID=M0AK86_NATA1|nr:hypothetical protein [Natrialba asiatica]ELY98776.1 hypothetical protein C481_16552 [Natrialba asiatica DSM 12278]
MGLLELMLGQSGPGEQGTEGNSYTLPKDTHEFVYPVAVRRDELAAFAQLIEAEADAPYLEEETDELQDVFDDVLGDAGIDATELVEQKRRTRREAESVIDHWREQVTTDIATVYVLPETDETLLAFTKLCKQRDDEADDPFDLPETFADAAALLKRLQDATDSQYRAVVHTDLLESETA